jgi:hypothetical protein
MAKQPKKPKGARPDFAQTAFRIVQEATGQAEKTAAPDAGKDPAAIARGRKGGLKGGKSRAQKTTPSQRAEIAKKAANARWGNKGQ